MRWLPFVNLLLVILIGLSMIGIVFSLSFPTSNVETIPVSYEKQLPKSPFAVAKLMNPPGGPLTLKWVEPTLELPNLSSVIGYYGLIERPDALADRPRFHISLIDCDDIHTAVMNEPFYLAYNKPSSSSDHPAGSLWGETEVEGGYYPSNEPTPLWLEMTPRHNGKLLDVTVHMKDGGHQEILTPSKHRHFTLSAQELPKRSQSTWELDDCRVDSTLLIRQKARWIGPDCFLRQHGGEEYAYALERERIDFCTRDQVYSCFVKPGDFLVWKEGRWHEGYLFKGPTTHLPLLSVKKLDEKIISFELWDSEGISKIPLNLIKAREMGGEMPNLSEELRFVGAKTWAQFIVESRSGRLLLRPYDWLVLTQEGWIKLDSPKKIDDYVTLRLVGPLLILDKMNKQNGKQVLTGHLYNLSRNDVQKIEIPASLNAYATQCTPALPLPPSSEPLLNGGLE